MMALLNCLAFVQACLYLFFIFTSESNQGGKFDFLTVILGIHVSTALS